MKQESCNPSFSILSHTCTRHPAVNQSSTQILTGLPSNPRGPCVQREDKKRNEQLDTVASPNRWGNKEQSVDTAVTEGAG